jgi:hypothetical protein
MSISSVPIMDDDMRYEAELRKLDAALKERAVAAVDRKLQAAQELVRELQTKRATLTGKTGKSGKSGKGGRGRAPRSPETIEKMRVAANARWAKAKADAKKKAAGAKRLD